MGKEKIIQYDTQAILTDLKQKKEMQADQHDGCYELMRETINAYAKLSDLSVLDYKDLNLVFLTTIGTWRQGLDSKKEKINESHLSPQDQIELIKLWDDVWVKAGQQVYSNSDTSTKDKRSIGLFGTGFFSFGSNTSSEKVKDFISMLIDILQMDNDEEMFNRAEDVLSSPFPGMQTAAASMILHCLKPYSFPILNSNSGNNNIFEVLGINLSNVYTLETYIKNCRLIKEYRDKNFSYKNYRIFDLEAQDVDRFKIDGKIYGFSEMVSFLSTYSGVHYTAPEKAGEKAAYMKALKERGQGARQKLISFAEKIASLFPDLEYSSCAQWKNQGQTVERYLWVELKNSKWMNYPQSVSISIERHDDMYPGEGFYLSIRAETRDASSKPEDYKRQMRLLDCSLSDGMTYRTMMYKNQKYVYHGTDRDEVKRLCDDGTICKVEIIEAIENLPEKDNEGSILSETLKAVKEIYPLYDYVMQQENKESEPNVNTEENNVMEQLGHNIILYGPPGTGKTYSTAKYAVSICDGKNISDLNDYPAVMKRYNELVKDGRISFVTFHQSYGYEEFIEGIKPIVDDRDQDVGYRIEAGVFKKFCESAVEKKVTLDGVDCTKARVWSVLLDGTGSSDLKKECFNSENSCIRIGWTNAPKEIEDVSQVSSKQVYDIITDFQYEMQEGDIVVTQLTNHSIDAIGIIGKYSFDDSNKAFPRKREVNWLVTGCDIDILELNKNVKLPRKSVCTLYRISADKILSLIDNNKTVAVSKEVKPYVFIIDEINRGNISKIFGELITLIEETKREGKGEAASAVLPYSKERFSVPDNVYIIGTMNTADRSIALMDTALRRRFQFVEMMPDADVLRELKADKVGTLDVALMLEKINERITCLYDREHTIGHAFFTGLASDPSIEKLAEIFEKSIIPLLQEYFYEDYQKIQLVLGDNVKDPKYKFIGNETIKKDEVFKGNISDYDLPETKYFINKDAFKHIESYIQII